MDKQWHMGKLILVTDYCAATYLPKLVAKNNTHSFVDQESGSSLAGFSVSPKAAIKVSVGATVILQFNRGRIPFHVHSAHRQNSVPCELLK